jgi:DHA1 family multidrug/chloramphenicol efflux transport protein-like MFS transporter
MTIGIILIALLPYLYGNSYHYLLPGIIIYFFALSIINAPLNRFCLFITSVSKGTASALVSLSVMIIGAIGIEIASAFYQQHNNLYFGIFCNAVGALFLIFIGLTFMSEQEKERHVKNL